MRITLINGAFRQYRRSGLCISNCRQGMLCYSAHVYYLIALILSPFPIKHTVIYNSSFNQQRLYMVPDLCHFTICRLFVIAGRKDGMMQRRQNDH